MIWWGYFRHPGRWSFALPATTVSKSFQAHDGLLNLLTLCLQVCDALFRHRYQSSFKAHGLVYVCKFHHQGCDGFLHVHIARLQRSHPV